MLVRLVPEHVLLAVRLDERDPPVRAPGQAHVPERHVVDREEAAGRAVLRAHVPERRAVRERERRHTRPEVLDEFADDTGAAQDLRHRQHEVGRGRPLAQRAAQPETEHLRHEHRQRLAEHRRFRFDASDAPTEHAEAVHHRRMRVGADERVRERCSVARLDHAREVLEIHLMADACVRRDDLQRLERLLPPAQERVALAVPRELELDVALDREPSCQLVHLHRVVDDELDRDERIDLRGVAALVAHRVAHRREVDDRGNAGEVLQENPRGHEGDLVRGLRSGVPVEDRRGVAAVAQTFSSRMRSVYGSLAALASRRWISYVRSPARNSAIPRFKQRAATRRAAALRVLR